MVGIDLCMTASSRGYVKTHFGGGCAKDSHALSTNVVIAWNTYRMDRVVDRMRKDGIKIEDAWLRRMGPAHFGNINFRGTFRFGLDKYAQSLIRHPTVARRTANG